jgi:hypothetical protein
VKRSVLLLTVAIVLVAGTRSSAHHSFAAVYDTEARVTIEGTVYQFLFRAAHSFLHVDAPDSKGVMQRWAIEWVPGNQLNREGITKETLRFGDKVTVLASPARNPAEHRLLMRRVTKPDGFKWDGVVE